MSRSERHSFGSGKRPSRCHLAIVCGSMPSAAAISMREVRFLRSMHAPVSMREPHPEMESVPNGAKWCLRGRKLDARLDTSAETGDGRGEGGTAKSFCGNGFELVG